MVSSYRDLRLLGNGGAPMQRSMLPADDSFGRNSQIRNWLFNVRIGSERRPETALAAIVRT